MSVQDLIKLVESGSVKSVRDFLSSHKINLDQSALNAAVEGGNIEVVKLLIEHGAKVDLTMAETSSLAIACRHGVEMVKTLLREADIKSIKGFTSCMGTASPKKRWNFSYLSSPVNIAAKYGQVELVKWLLEQGVEAQFGALFFAISRTKVDMVRELLIHGANANATGDGGWSALMLASLYGNEDIIRMLLDKNASVNFQDEKKEFALLLAVESLHVAAVILLLDNGAQVNLKGPNGAIAITSAIASATGYFPTKKKLSKIVQTLLKFGADVNLPDKFGFSALYAAIYIDKGDGCVDTVKQLLDNGGLIETVSWRALRFVVLNKEILQVFLDRGLKIDQQDESGKSLLMHTSNMETIRLLLAWKADVNLQDNDGRCALLNAVCNEKYDVAELLLNNGADLHLRAHNGESAASILQFKNISMSWFASQVVQYPNIRAFLSKMPPTKSLPVKHQSHVKQVDSAKFEQRKLKEEKFESKSSEDLKESDDKRESCNKNRDQEQFVSDIKEAIAKDEVIGRKHAHSVFIGPPGTGKSSMMDRLLLRKRKAFSSSTGISECVVVVDIDIDDLSSFRVATVTNPEVWEETDYDVSLVKQMNDRQESALPLPHNQELPKVSPPTQPLTSAVVMPKADVSLSSEMEPATPHSVAASLSKFSSDEITSKINAVIEKCGGFRKFHESFSKSFSLYLRDAGGHMAFQEMLSVLILGPSIFIFVFRADLDLKDKFRVEYRASAGTSLNCINSSVTTEEAFLQFLSSVYAMDKSGKAGVKTHKPLVFIVGTHKDKLGHRAEEKITELNEHLDSLIDSSHCFQDLVQYADREKGQVMFTVDNTSKSDEDFALIRSKIYSLVSERSEFTIEYPVSYLFFALELKHEKVAYLGIDECKTIAAKYGIVGDQVSHLLYFLHYRVGIIQYFDVEGIVMIKPGVLFNKMTHLITTTFSRKSLTSKEVRDFQKGILTASLIKMVVGEGGIDSNILLKLLTHLHIIIPIASGDEEKYFIPCVLNHVNASSKKDFHTGILPLSVRFQCEHCPKGLFSVLVTQLITFESKEESGSLISFSLVENKIFRDQVSFEVHSQQFADQDEITLKNLPSHLEICFYPYSLCAERDMSVNEMCCAIRQQIEEAISKSLCYLRYDPHKVRLFMCFKCDICHELHPVKKGIKAHKIFCKSARETRRIPPLGRFWYNEGTAVSTPAALMCNDVVPVEARLSEHDFAWLFEKLCPHSFKWQEIGIGLRFTASELSIIRHRPTLLTTAPHSYLSAMLSDWLQWAPGDARGSTNYATLNSLRDAVDKAGLGRAAQEFHVHQQYLQQQMPQLATAVAIISLLYILYQDLST